MFILIMIQVFTYRYFLHQWPELCIIAHDTKDGKVIGCVVCKIDEEEDEYAMENDNLQVVNTTPERSLDDNDAKQNDITNESTIKQQELIDEQAVNTTNTNQPIQQHHNISNKQKIKSGYMAMLAVDQNYRKTGIGTELVKRVVNRMRLKGCTSVMLETEVSNKVAMRLYEDRLGFIREELLVRYYLNYGDAYRLRLWFCT